MAEEPEEPEESAGVFCMATPDDIDISSYVHQIETWNVIKIGSNPMGCGINVLAFLGFITSEDGQKLLTDRLKPPGTSLNVLYDFIKVQFSYLANYTITYDSFLENPNMRGHQKFNPLDKSKRTAILKHITDDMMPGCMTILKFDLNSDTILDIPHHLRVGHTVIGFKGRNNQLYIVDPQKKQVLTIEEFITGKHSDASDESIARYIKGIMYFKKTRPPSPEIDMWNSPVSPGWFSVAPAFSLLGGKRNKRCRSRKNSRKNRKVSRKGKSRKESLTRKK